MVIKKEKFEEFMKENGITYCKKYYLNDDSIIDRDIGSVSNLIFEEPLGFIEIYVFWNPRREQYETDIDSILETYGEEWEDFCKGFGLDYEDTIEKYEI